MESGCERLASLIARERNTTRSRGDFVVRGDEVGLSRGSRAADSRYARDRPGGKPVGCAAVETPRSPRSVVTGPVAVLPTEAPLNTA